LTIFPELEDVFELIRQGSPSGSKKIVANLNIHQNTAPVVFPFPGKDQVFLIDAGSP